MQPVSPCLAIDYGAAHTQAVLCRPGGSWLPVPLEAGSLELSSAVHSGADGTVLIGAQAWRRAADDPDGFVPSPPALRAGGAESVTVAGREVALAWLAAASLRHVAGRAAQLAGGPVEDVRLVVPAGWGPKRQQWLRQAARQAGLGMPRLVPAPVAAGQRLLATPVMQVQVPVGAFLLLVDLGAGAEVSVLRRGPLGLEILATIADPQAGGAAGDDHLLQALALAPAGGPAPPDQAAAPPVPDGHWMRLAAIRTAREQLSQQATVTVPLPPGPPAVVHAQVADQATAPVWQAAADLAARTLAAAELTADQLAGIYLVGGTAATPAAAAAISARLGAPAQAVHQPAFTAVLGAADADNQPAQTLAAPLPPGNAAGAWQQPVGERRWPPRRRLAGMALPGVAALALWVHAMATADFHNGTPQYRGLDYWVRVTGGELGAAAVLAVLGCLSCAGVFATLLADRRRRDPAEAGPVVMAALSGLAVAAMLGLITAAVLNLRSLGEPLRWALLPALPVAVTATVVAVLAYRRARPPAGGWDAFFVFPLSALVLITPGLMLLGQWYSASSVPGWYEPLAQIGAGMMGAGLACVLFRHLGLRAATAVFLAVFAFVVMNPNTLGVVVAIAVTVRLGYQARLLFTPPVTPGMATPAPAASGPP